MAPPIGDCSSSSSISGCLTLFASPAGMAEGYSLYNPATGAESVRLWRDGRFGIVDGFGEALSLDARSLRGWLGAISID